MPKTNDIKWSSMFVSMETAKARLKFEDYSISQTTLEQVFLSFTKSYNEQASKWIPFSDLTFIFPTLGLIIINILRKKIFSSSMQSWNQICWLLRYFVILICDWLKIWLKWTRFIESIQLQFCRIIPKFTPSNCRQY